ncbi:tyrosine-type recombinase/integrase [Mesorhizobium sp. XAP10]|uniref:tyrosine-type recombinase/integrase n=1 Tax=unclassified Mesorhizobium TaxID=325217 RepID=UPI0023DF6CC5|nr:MULTISPECIES: tyrosine-type recombinase/integrase [unclassified Mesorhizobium]MDF3156696.1 tyrosine-type recombinase/integrase [Mesorhizobium sp. XAP10]MDF3249588.1 tyrosine-type recombinase/integrase [Mesorhizobium sp. XAP4]
MTAFAQFLGEKAERYIELRHSLGYPFSKQAGTLRAFVRYVGRAQLDAPATRTMALDFVLSFSGAANSRAIRHGVLRRFYEYLAVYDARTEGLERRAFPRSRAIPPPRILSEAELTSLIDACARISPSIPLRGRTMATLIGLLASSGLRSGEVVGLDRSDVDLTNGVLLVRKTKFRKDRLVPVHTTTQCALGCYARERDAAFPIPKDQAFFLSSRGNRLSATGLQNGFAEVRKLADFDGGKPLRPHDLRHRFAVTRLSLWHQQRADVQALLPLLATYLGHVSYSDTAYYLTGSAELLAIAAERAALDGGAA